jgi:hypothetical protein
MTIHAFIPTRSKEIKPITKRLLKYLADCGVKISLIVNSKSIFSGYRNAFEKALPNPHDIIILCHDDIEIINTPESFLSVLFKYFSMPGKVGFIGPAGTTHLGVDATWWDHARWKAGLHKGFVLHGEELKDCRTTYYGEYGQVVALDGLFLATTAKTLQSIGIDKPEYFEGAWDFYDIHYTTKAHLKGLKNYTAPIIVLHNSIGEIDGRDSWHKNREAFVKNTKLPLSV